MYKYAIMTNSRAKSTFAELLAEIAANKRVSKYSIGNLDVDISKCYNETTHSLPYFKLLKKDNGELEIITTNNSAPEQLSLQESLKMYNSMSFKLWTTEQEKF